MQSERSQLSHYSARSCTGIIHSEQGGDGL